MEKPPVSTPAAAGACSGSRFGVVRRVSDHHRVRRGKAQPLSATPTMRGSGLPCSTSSPHAVASINFLDRKSDPAAAQRERLENLALAGVPSRSGAMI
jgi:hypothetical protein